MGVIGGGLNREGGSRGVKFRGENVNWRVREEGRLEEVSERGGVNHRGGGGVLPGLFSKERERKRD